ncbi:hypothetical protein JAK45_19465 [Stenotrophomonas maltophilia]|nr:hypothetical protein [Stenotrophomonas maltophilia]
MKMEGGIFSIEAYRDFYDVPRLMLATDVDSAHWIFECAFDDEAEEYAGVYRIYAVRPGVQGIDAITDHLKDGTNPVVATVAVSTLKFDESNRKTFVLYAQGHEE